MSISHLSIRIYYNLKSLELARVSDYKHSPHQYHDTPKNALMQGQLWCLVQQNRDKTKALRDKPERLFVFGLIKP